jgi:hypothetical protein
VLALVDRRSFQFCLIDHERCTALSGSENGYDVAEFV